MNNKKQQLQGSKVSVAEKSLIGDLRYLIENTKNKIFYTSNAELVILHWNIGKRIQEEIIQNQRAEYGDKIVATVSRQFSWSKFKAADKGQMELYLRWLDKNERKRDEKSPLGIILCTDKNHEQVELLELAHNGIHVAEFITELPSAEVFEKKLQKAIEYAKARLEKTC